MTHDSEDVTEAIAGELRLMDPAVRGSRTLTGQLLDLEFVEVGSSGRRWTREHMLTALPFMAGSSAGGLQIEPADITAVVLAPGLVHLTYESVIGVRRARRSSLWRKVGESKGWQLYYHQGTPVPPGIV